MNKTGQIRAPWLMALVILALGGFGLSLPGLKTLEAPAPQVTTATEAASTVVKVPAAPAASLVQSTLVTAPTSLLALEACTPGAACVLDETAAANAMEAQVEAIYDAISPSVVNITNRSTVYDRWMGSSSQEGTGSGFVLDTAEGYILTNYHVIENADELLVTLADGQVYSASVVGSDPTNDLAVLRLDDKNVELPPALPLGDSEALHVGQSVVAIGNPYGLQRTLTTGVVSALGRVIESPVANQYIGEAIQTDAAINPGNSGGPMLNLSGEVIGINSQILSPSGASAGIGFAVSVNTVKRVVPQLIATGHYAHAWLGVEPLELSSYTTSVLRQAGVEVGSDSGVLVLQADPGGPAEQAGIRGGSQIMRMGRYRLPVGGDMIVAVNGEPVSQLQDLTLYLETETTVGETVQVTVLRSGKELTLKVTLAEQPQN